MEIKKFARELANRNGIEQLIGIREGLQIAKETANKICYNPELLNRLTEHQHILDISLNMKLQQYYEEY